MESRAFAVTTFTLAVNSGVMEALYTTQAMVVTVDGKSYHDVTVGSIRFFPHVVDHGGRGKDSRVHIGHLFLLEADERRKLLGLLKAKRLS